VIDTTGGFDVLRLHQIIKLRLQRSLAAQRAQEPSNINPQIFNGPDANEDWDEAADQALNRVKIMRVFDFVGVSEAIDELRDDMRALRLKGILGTVAVAIPTQRTHIDDSESEEEDLMLFDGANDEAESAPTVEEAVSMIVVENITHVVHPILKSDYVQGLYSRAPELAEQPDSFGVAI